MGQPRRYSEMSAWAQCRQRWHWEYKCKLEKSTLSAAVARGLLGHHLLEHTYKEYLTTGSIPSADKLLTVAIKWSTENMVNVFEDELAEFQEVTCVQTVQQVLDHHARYNDFDTYHILEVEKQFQVDVPGLPNPVLGTIDLLVKSRTSDKIWILEHKFYARLTEPFELSRQFATYQASCKAMGIDISGLILNQIALPPKKPSLNKDKSMSRVKVGDWETYRRELIANGLNPKDYQDMKDKLPENAQFRRDIIYRSPVEQERGLIEIARVMNDIEENHEKVYMCDSIVVCRTCQFYELCVESLKGGDVPQLIADKYKEKKKQYDTDNLQTIASEFMA